LLRNSREGVNYSPEVSTTGHPLDTSDIYVKNCEIPVAEQENLVKFDKFHIETISSGKTLVKIGSACIVIGSIMFGVSVFWLAVSTVVGYIVIGGMIIVAFGTALLVPSGKQRVVLTHEQVVEAYNSLEEGS
jgi:hypothetical protein